MDAPSPSTSAGGPAHLASLDVARGVAILMVIAYHTLDAALGMIHIPWNGWWPDFAHAPRTLLLLLPVSWSWVSVAIFFAVSGFCIHWSHARAEDDGWKLFFLRRFFRIYPPYLLALCFFALIFPPTRFGEFTWRHAGQFGSHLFLAHNADGRLVCGINPSFWTIAVEVQLYLLYPLLWGTAKRIGWGRAMLLAGGIECTLRAADFWWRLPCFVNTSPLYYLLSWGVGAKLADDLLHGRPLFLIRWPLWLFAVATAACLVCGPLETFAFPLTALTTVRAIAGSLAKTGGTALSASLARGLAGVGFISYSLYLLHQPVLNAFVLSLKAAWFPPLRPLLLFACGLAFCAPVGLAAWYFYRTVELRSIAWGKRIVQRRRNRAKTGVPTAYAR